MIRLVTDSTADYTADLAAADGVTVVPLTVIFGDEEFRDRVDMSADDFYTRLTTGTVQPRTSQPSPEAFAAVYRDLLREPDDGILSLHISSGLSGTYQSASLAAQEFGGRVAVVDTKTISGGLQMVIRAATAMIAGGAGLEELAATMEAARPKSHLFVALDTLTYLQRGGRIGRASAFVGGVLGVKPVLELREGVVEPHSRARSFSKAVATVIELVNAHPKLDGIEVMYSTEREIADDVAGKLGAAHPGVPVKVGQIGPVVGTYVGPGTVGVAFLEA